MIKQILPTVLACSIIFLASCSVSNKSMRYQASSPVIEMNKGACFGQCPVYRLSLYSDGTVLYEGLRFTDRVGIYSRNLTSSEQRTLDHNLSNLSWDSYKGYYESRLPDLQMITLSDGIHTVKFKEECPVELEVLSNLLSKYADSGNWEKLADHSTSPDYTKDNVTVQLVDGHTANEVIQDLQLANVSVLKEVSSSMNTWLLKYDSQKISAGQIFYALKQHKGIKNVEFDIQLKLRDE